MTEQRQHEATARQCLADTLAATGLHAHAGPDRRELVLNELVERALHAYEDFRRLEERTRHGWAEGTSPHDPALHAGLGRAAQLHLEIGRGLVSQLDTAAVDRLTVRNALAFRQSYAALVALEALDHGLLPGAIHDLATAAHSEFTAGKTQEIDADDDRNGVASLRTWDFVKRTAALPNAVQLLAEKRYRTFFALDDRHPALGGRPLFGGRRNDALWKLWSVEISFDHRAFAVLPDAPAGPRCYVWFWIGSPEDCLRVTTSS
jgi:hypothetical protein